MLRYHVRITKQKLIGLMIATVIVLSVGCLPSDAKECQPGHLYGPDNISGKLIGWAVCSGK